MDAVEIIKLIIAMGFSVLAIAAIIMPLMIILINSKLNKIIQLLQTLAER